MTKQALFFTGLLETVLKFQKGCHIIIDDYNCEQRSVVRIDVTKEPPEPIYFLTKEEQKFADMTLD